MKGNLSMNEVASVIFAAGRGSRMVGFSGNKTLLPLEPENTLYQGKAPLLLEVLRCLPPGPRGIVVHHRADDVRCATEHIEGVSYLFQPVTNGTGGALLAARPFLEAVDQSRVLITMGDVPLIRPETYSLLVERLSTHALAVLVFEPADKGQYGMLEMDGERPVRIVEWKYWNEWPPERQEKLKDCNAGVYAVRRDVLLPCLDRMAGHPHRVKKQKDGEWVIIEEYFLTDLVEWIGQDGLSMGVLHAPEEEVMGVDSPEALQAAQKIYAERGR